MKPPSLGGQVVKPQSVEVGPLSPKPHSHLRDFTGDMNHLGRSSTCRRDKVWRSTRHRMLIAFLQSPAIRPHLGGGGLGGDRIWQAIRTFSRCSSCASIWISSRSMLTLPLGSLDTAGMAWKIEQMQSQIKSGGSSRSRDEEGTFKSTLKKVICGMDRPFS